jgi:hypothetical protein
MLKAPDGTLQDSWIMGLVVGYSTGYCWFDFEHGLQLAEPMRYYSAIMMDGLEYQLVDTCNIETIEYEEYSAGMANQIEESLTHDDLMSAFEEAIDQIVSVPEEVVDSLDKEDEV